MTVYSKIRKGKVVELKDVNASFFNTFVDSSPGTWTEVKSSTKNTPYIGNYYNATADAYYTDKPSEEYELNTSTFKWELIKPYPSDGKKYVWDNSDWRLAS